MMDRRAFIKTGAGLAASAALSSTALSSVPDVSGAPTGFHNAAPGGVGPQRLALVSGRMPVGLSGALFRNGPAHFRRGSQILDHWFDGDGLVRAYRIADGQVHLTARFVQTTKRRHDTQAGRFIMPGFGTKAAAGAPLSGPDDANAANTSVMKINGQLWALWEAGSPYALDPDTLSTVGPVTLRSDLAQMPFSAHPKADPDGFIWNFGMAYGYAKTFVWGIAPSGQVMRAGVLDLPAASYMHDWCVTKTKLIFPLQPWVFARRRPPFVQSLAWQPDRGLQILVVDKNDFNNRQLYHLPAGAFFHTGDAYEEADGTIRFDICMAAQPVLGADAGAALLRGHHFERSKPDLKLITLKPDGTASAVSSGLIAEFPRIDPRLNGKPRTRVYTVTEGRDVISQGYRFNAIQAFDWASGKTDAFDFGTNVLVEEPVFAPDSSADDKGWLLVSAVHLAERKTQLHIFNADAVSDGPVASLAANTALPISFHGNWYAV